MVLKRLSQTIKNKFSKRTNNIHTKRKRKILNKHTKKYKGGTYRGPGYGPMYAPPGMGYYPNPMDLDASAFMYINQMIAHHDNPTTPVAMHHFIEQMRVKGYAPHFCVTAYSRQLANIFGPPVGPPMEPRMVSPMGYPTGPPMGAAMNYPMSPAMASPIRPPMGAAMNYPISPAMATPLLGREAESPPPPPAILKRVPSDTVSLFQGLKSDPQRRITLSDIMHRDMNEFNFGGVEVQLAPAMNGKQKMKGYMSKQPSGYYFNWVVKNEPIIQACHLTLHKTPSMNATGTLHVRDDQSYDKTTKNSQSIKINIERVDSNHNNITIEDKTNPPNAKLFKFAEDIVNVIIQYYVAIGETASRV